MVYKVGDMGLACVATAMKGVRVCNLQRVSQRGSGLGCSREVHARGPSMYVIWGHSSPASKGSFLRFLRYLPWLLLHFHASIFTVPLLPLVPMVPMVHLSDVQVQIEEGDVR